MKSLIKNTVVAIMLLVAVTNASAADGPVKVKVAGEKSIELSFAEITGKVWITFKDEQGTVFYSKRIKDLASYKVKYDLAAFPDGEYRLELASVDQTLNVPVAIVKGIVTLKKELAAAPVISKKGNMVAVELSGKKENAWDVTIKSEEGEVIFSETVENGSTLSKRKYDLSNLNDGKYLVQFKTEGNTFTHSVVKH